MRPLAETLWAGAATAISPGLRLLLRRRAARGKEIHARLAERRGIDRTPRPDGALLWLHAASVGEAMSALPVVAALPGTITTLFTTGTVTSARLLEARLPALGLSGRVLHRFVPLDVPAWVDRFLNHWRPDAACFLESELWPTMLAGCRAREIPAALVNARLSRRSARAWRRAPGLARRMLGGFAFIAAQSAADADRLQALSGRSVDVLGNLKYAAPALPADALELKRLDALLEGRPRWLAASTHPADDAVVARVHRALVKRFPQLLTAIAPRHPERGAALAALMGGAPRRALGEDPDAHAVWIADTMGEMGLLYRLFPVVFMGKSFAGGGGQNFLEPARLGCAVATGPRTENFSEAREMALAAGALTVVQDEEALIHWLGQHLEQPRETARYDPGGDTPAILARRLAALIRLPRGSLAAQRGDDLAAGRPAEAPGSGARPGLPASGADGPPQSAGPAAQATGTEPPLPRDKPAPGAGTLAGQAPKFWRHGEAGIMPAMLAPLSPVVAGVTARRMARPGWRAPVPVICCGNATVGGAGKTTLALALAGRLHARGIAVHFLTRGYRGAAQGTVRVDSARHSAAEVGDEALLLAAVAPTWRGADRAEAAALAVQDGAQALIMDDGLQNPTLHKTLTFLVIDGPAGFGNGRVMPAGPLREPVRSAAARADAAVLIGKDETGARARLPSQLPVLHARLVAAPTIAALAGKTALAFAGIGRPEKFFAMLIEAGVILVESKAFPDHHPYREADIDPLLRRARAAGATLVTTPKDAVRLPPGLRSLVGVIGVSLAVEDEPALDALLVRGLKGPAFR